MKEITEGNYDLVSGIYQEGLDTGVATFETSVPNWEAWDSSHLPFGRILLYKGDQVMGWAALSPVSSRCVYGGVAEVSVYVSKASRGQGVGYFLLNKLITVSESNDIWTLQSGIFRENVGSHRLHLKCGFREIGYKEKVGQLNGKWLDNILLERRSEIVGV